MRTDSDRSVVLPTQSHTDTHTHVYAHTRMQYLCTSTGYPQRTMDRRFPGWDSSYGGHGQRACDVVMYDNHVALGSPRLLLGFRGESVPPTHRVMSKQVLIPISTPFSRQMFA